MRTWAIANQKGGVGKTTSTVSLAGILSARGYNTLLVDADPHGSMTSYFKLDPDGLEDSVYALFCEGADQAHGLVRETGMERLHLLPASTALATLDRQLGTKEGMGLVLARALAELGDRFDHVLIDCPPTLGILMVNALAACEELIIPVQTEFLAVKGLERMLRTLSMINRARPTPLPYLIVPTMFDRRTRASIETLRVLRERYGHVLWDGVIPVDTQFREASRAGVPLPLMNARTRGAVAYDGLVDRLLGLQHHATDETRVAS